mmetsp:Transcript_27697/g.31075  ORF Transcript_27697/g.31075 Transcript_27697/m.31075 type:complete len:160 (+) Transcript_27697:199-678(+)
MKFSPHAIKQTAKEVKNVGRYILKKRKEKKRKESAKQSQPDDAKSVPPPLKLSLSEDDSRGRGFPEEWDPPSPLEHTCCVDRLGRDLRKGFEKSLKKVGEGIGKKIDTSADKFGNKIGSIVDRSVDKLLTKIDKVLFLCSFTIFFYFLLRIIDMLGLVD